MNGLAILWSRFGPYHLSRLDATARWLNTLGWQVIGLEIAAYDLYAWSLISGVNPVKRVTLFEDARYETLGRARIVAATWKALTVHRPRAVAINGWAVPEAWAACFWAKLHGAKIIVMSETMRGEKSRRYLSEGVKRLFVAQCAGGIVGGRPHRDYLVSLGMPAERIALGYDAVDNNYFTTGAEAARVHATELRARLNLPERYFFANCRFITRKNVHGLLRAYRGYFETVQKPWGLVISGAGEEEKNLKHLASGLGLKHVRWPGFLQYPDLPAYYGLAGAFVHPALSEPWGLVVNEAGASGLPLLVSRTVGSASELVDSEWNGFTFDPFNIADLTSCLVRITGLPVAERVAMGQRSSERVQHWGPGRFADGLAEVLGLNQQREVG